AQKYEANISGHRDWAATDCPGGMLYADLPSIRQEVAAAIAGPTPTPSPTPTATPTTPPPPTTTTVPASSVSIQRGSAVGDPVSNLSSDDGVYYRVKAARVNSSKYTATWYGQASLGVPGVTKLTFTYDGASTSTSTQTL